MMSLKFFQIFKKLQSNFAHSSLQNTLSKACKKQRKIESMKNFLMKETLKIIN